ncbi:DUF456 domain-containing protein [Chryseobacterium sp. MFBS3-17]|uniref:DUF456 domain-containing protein n=1 Tax=Chryseobacterium sp. MFBS3-17 TaxID=2886689 RepID=UPI001D0EE2F4|nr:DUF456 domain-containing protein [Chryseobacterium sp. MFBS3-17]MCC2591516.1 DUF456 domain-containing protein [Chryseobacterium sp. MFBS3-17]
MDHGLITLVCFILLILGMAGTILPILPGLLMSLCGLLIYKFGTESELSMVYIWIFSALTLLSIVLNYVIPAKTNRRYGGTRWGSIGSVIGTFAGMFFIPLPFGFLIGMFLGVFAGELLHDSKDPKKAFNSMKGAFVGFIFGTGFNFLVGLAMFLVVLFDVI